jgi:hypothetical protein
MLFSLFAANIFLVISSFHSDSFISDGGISSYSLVPASPASDFMSRLQRAVHALHVTLRNSWSASDLAEVRIFGLLCSDYLRAPLTARVTDQNELSSSCSDRGHEFAWSWNRGSAQWCACDLFGCFLATFLNSILHCMVFTACCV